MSKTSLLWIIAALCFLLVAAIFDGYDAKNKAAALEKELIIMKAVDKFNSSN
jgi:hypothetical protein